VPISTTYRPVLSILTGCMVGLDGWGAGQPGQDVESANGVVDAQGTTWYLTKIEGWHDAPLPRLSMSARAGEHGAFDGPAYLEPRVITIEGVAVCADRISAWRARDIAASVLGDASLGLSTLVVTQAGYLTRQAEVRRSGDIKTAPMAANAFRWSIVLVAPNPRRYSDTLSTQSVGLPQGSGSGLVFPLLFPLDFGSAQAGGDMTLTNAGTMATWPTWEILGPLDGPIITAVASGEQLLFDPTLTVPDGETLIIDTDAKTVLLSGINVRDRLFTAGWFHLDPGDTQVRFQSTAGSDPDAQLTATWRDAWS